MTGCCAPSPPGFQPRSRPSWRFRCACSDASSMTMTDGRVRTMTISTLDAKAALVVIDLQKGIVGMSVAHPIDGVIRNAVALAEAFRAQKLPVVLVNVDG